MNETSVTTTKARRRRFKRDSEFRSDKTSAGRIKLQRRDINMVAAIAQHRFLNTEQVIKLFACDCPTVEVDGVRGGQPARIEVKRHRPQCACTCGIGLGYGEHASQCPNLFKTGKHVASRLLELFQAGYLERPVAQLQLRIKNGVITTGSVPMVYAVTKEGLGLIGEERRKALGGGKMSWVAKVNEGGRMFMEHTLAVADVSVGLDVALRGHTHLERLTEQQLRAGMNAERQASVRPYGLRVKYKSGKLSAVCDLAFAIGDKTARKRWNFLAEIDMGHMPVKRRGLSQTSIARKLVAYAKAFEDGLHKEAFDWRGFRVLLLTTSPERVQSCVKAVQELFGSSAVARIFLFGTLDAAQNILGADFVDGRGRISKLIE